MAVAAPHLHTRVGGVYIRSHTTAHVALRLHLEDHLARPRIAQFRAVLAVLMTIPHLQLRALRVEGHQVDGIAMSHAGVIQSTSVIVHRHRSIGDLILAVAIHIGHAQVMVTLSCIACPLGGVRIESPAVLQFLAIPVPGGNHGPCVVAPAEDGRGTLPVEVAHARQHTV